MCYLAGRNAVWNTMMMTVLPTAQVAQNDKRELSCTFFGSGQAWLNWTICIEKFPKIKKIDLLMLVKIQTSNSCCNVISQRKEKVRVQL